MCADSDEAWSEPWSRDNRGRLLGMTGAVCAQVDLGYRRLCVLLVSWVRVARLRSTADVGCGLIWIMLCALVSFRIVKASVPVVYIGDCLGVTGHVCNAACSGGHVRAQNPHQLVHPGSYNSGGRVRVELSLNSGPGSDRSERSRNGAGTVQQTRHLAFRVWSGVLVMDIRERLIVHASIGSITGRRLGSCWSRYS